MKLDQVFGIILILLAIYLGVNAANRGNVDGGLFTPSDPGSSSGGLFSRDANPTDRDTSTDPDRAATPDDADGRDDNGRDDDVRDDADGTARDASNADDAARRSNQTATSDEVVIVRSDFCAAAPGRSAYVDLGNANDAAIRCVEAAGIMTGTSSTQFDPGAAVTRGQAAAAIAAMIDRANELEAKGVDLRGLPEANDARFEDITTDTPHRLAIARLNETPILQGYVDARYEPRGKVTRAQMASLLDRSYQYMNKAALPLGPDQFRDDERSVHEESINAVAGVDIMHGVSDQRFAPNRSVRRGEMASYIARIMVRMEDKNRIMSLPGASTK